MRKKYLKFRNTSLLIVITLAVSQIASAGNTPNVVLVYVDDMRTDMTSYAGHPYMQTPNLDRLANEGVAYTNAFVNTPLCGPSRGTLMTGLLASEHGLRNHDVVNTATFEEHAFLPQLIHDAGVNTAFFGKWHNGVYSSSLLDAFDYRFVNRGTPDPGNYLEEAYFNRYYDDNGTIVQIEDYNTDVMFDKLSGYVLDQSESDQPFYAITSIFSPHYPYDPAPRHLNQYEGLGIPDRPNQEFEGMPSYINGQPLIDEYEAQAEMILAIDEGVGQLYQTLEDAGILDDTIVIFTSDNGHVFGEHGSYSKALPYQESIQVPLFVRWGSNFAPNQASDSLISQADLTVTIAEMLGADLPDGLYGRSFSDKWNAGEVDTEIDFVVSLQYAFTSGTSTHTPIWATIITEDGWKYIAVPDEDIYDLDTQGWIVRDIESMLINLNEDPYELNNLLGLEEYAEIEAALQQQLRLTLSENEGEYEWITVVPEPSSLAIMILGFAGLMYRRRH